MGKKSVRENKNFYFQAREAAGLTREEAVAATGISKSRLENIEYDTSAPRPDEVISMAREYKTVAIYNYYCSHDCNVGKEYIPEIHASSLAQASLEMLSSLNKFEEQKNRLIDIAADGTIDESEIHDLALIQERLNHISMAIDSFNLWIDEKVSAGVIDKGTLEHARSEL